MKGLAELTAENDEAVVRARLQRQDDDRKVFVKGWDEGRAFGMKRGRVDYRMKLRRILREQGIDALTRELTERPRKRHG